MALIQFEYHIKDCSEIMDTKLKAHIFLTFRAKSYINKKLSNFDKFLNMLDIYFNFIKNGQRFINENVAGIISKNMSINFCIFNFRTVLT